MTRGVNTNIFLKYETWLDRSEEEESDFHFSEEELSEALRKSDGYIGERNGFKCFISVRLQKEPLTPHRNRAQRERDNKKREGCEILAGDLVEGGRYEMCVGCKRICDIHKKHCDHIL